MAGVVGPDRSVGLPLHLQRLFPCDGGVVVNGDYVRAHVEAHIVTVEGAAQHAGDDMLTGVLLHEIKPAVPVHMTGDPGADGKLTGHFMIQDALLDADIQYFLSV